MIEARLFEPLHSSQTMAQLPVPSNEILTAWQPPNAPLPLAQPTGPGLQYRGDRRQSLNAGTQARAAPELRGLAPTEEQAWLATEAKWTNRLGHNNKGIKVLGRGSHGVVGLWERMDNHHTSPKYICVKQAGLKTEFFDSIGALLNEGNFLRLLGDCGTNHMVRMYRQVFIEEGRERTTYLTRVRVVQEMATLQDYIWSSVREVI